MLIADDFAVAPVLFADVVNFTPMSASRPPTDLKGVVAGGFKSPRQLPRCRPQAYSPAAPRPPWETIAQITAMSRVMMTTAHRG